MKWINKINYPQERKERLVSLRTAMQIIISFSVDPASNVPFLSEISRFADLVPRLKQDFFEKLYVNRGIQDSIYFKSFSNKPLIITGYTGIGKTCISVYNYLKLQEEKDCKVFYINVRDLITKMGYPKISTSNENKSKQQICSFLFLELYSQIFEQNGNLDLEWGNLQSYQAYRIRNHKGGHFLRFRRSIELTIQKRLSAIDDTELLGLATSSELINQYLNAGLAEEGEKDLLNLLFYLGKHFLHIIIIFDNIDRFKLEIQSNFLQKIEDLCEAEGDLNFTPIICVRKSNIKKLRFNEPNRSTGFEAQLMSVKEDDRYFSINIEDDACKRFIENRLGYLLSCDSNMFKRFELDLIRKEEVDRVLQELRSFLQLLSNYPEFITAINSWYNGSLRLLAMEVYSIASDIISEKDPILSLAYIAGADSALNRRRFRSYVFKRFVNGSELLKISHQLLRERDIFENFLRVSNIPFYCIKIKILEVIRNDKAFDSDEGLPSITYGRLIDIFVVRYGVNLQKLFRAINEIRVREEGSGLIFIDKKEDKIAANMPPDTVIELFQAGVFFLNTLSLSCEYLFWMAINTEVDKSVKIFRTNRMYSYTHTFDEDFKFDTVLNFLEQVLLKKTIAEMKGIMEGLHGTLRDNFAKYRYYFEVDGKIYLERVCERLTAFLRAEGSEIDDNNAKSYLKRIDIILDTLSNQKLKYK